MLDLSLDADDAIVARMPMASTPTDVASAFREHAPYVARVVTRLLGRGDEVQDVVQETFLKALTSMHQLRDPEAARGWLATIAVRVALRSLRVRRVRLFFGLDTVTECEALIGADASPEHALLLRRIYARLDELPAPQRIAWVLRHLEDEPLDRVAKICGCSLATAKRRIAAAHAVLETELSDDT